MKENSSNVSDSRKSTEVMAQIEIYPSPEYGDSYGTSNVSVQIDKKIYDQLKRGDINYKVLQNAIHDILDHNIQVIVKKFMVSGQLLDLKDDSYDWFHMDPKIDVLIIGEIDLSPIYFLDGQENKAAELLGANVDDIEDWVSDFITDCQFGLDQNVFRKLMNSN